MLGVNALLARNAALALVDPAFKKVVDSAVTERGPLLPPPPLSSGLGVNALLARNAALALVDPAFKKVVDSAVTARGPLLPPPPLVSSAGMASGRGGLPPLLVSSAGMASGLGLPASPPPLGSSFCATAVP